MRIAARMKVAGLAVALLCAVVVRAGSGELPLDEARANTGVGYRLIYVFNPEVDEHLERALLIQSLARNASPQVAVLGVTRGAFEATARRNRPFEFDTVSVGAARKDEIGGAALRSWLALSPGPRDDRFILEDASGVRLQGTGSSMGLVADVVAAEAVMTRVEFTTWAKMKELFQ